MMAHDLISRRSAKLTQAMLEVKTHRVFSMVRSQADLRCFMRWHVFAVWDFMSLVKRLQRELTCLEVPWVPPKCAHAARLINEIVIGEETDADGHGAHASHFEIYLAAMREVGAETDEIERFVALVREGVLVEEALRRLNVEPAIQAFVKSTIDMALHGDALEVLGGFFYGREDIIPAMFRRLLEDWAIEENAAPAFVYYLNRHIEIDGESHGPAASAIITSVAGDDERKSALLIEAAADALSRRMALWDALTRRLAQLKGEQAF